MVSRIRAGEPYYVAVGTELRQRQYPTLSVFNWRTPFLFSVLARMPEGTARAVLIGLTLALVVLSMAVLARFQPPVLIASLLLELGAATAFAVPQAVVISEAWAGVLVGLSLCAYLKGANRTGALLGLLALLVRELVAPWAVLCTALALRARRRSELYIWILGGFAYAFYFACHVFMVSSFHQPGDFAHQNSWLYGGGLPFILNTLRMNAFLLVSPLWVSAALLALLIAASASGATNVRLRLSIVIYLTCFAIAGQPFNYYWGLITVAIWPLAVPGGITSVVASVAAIRESFRRIDRQVPTRPM